MFALQAHFRIGEARERRRVSLRKSEQQSALKMRRDHRAILNALGIVLTLVQNQLNCPRGFTPTNPSLGLVVTWRLGQWQIDGRVT